MNLDGYAVGGLAVGESHEEMYHILDVTVPHLPLEKPTYLMGVGTPANILEAVDRGVDFFDCVYPSRNGRHGHVYTNQGKRNLFNAKYELDQRPIEEGCQCPACRNYSRGYIRHLLKAKEMLGMRLCVLHNLYFYNTMMSEIRQAIEEGRYKEYKKQKLEGFLENDKEKAGGMCNGSSNDFNTGSRSSKHYLYDRYAGYYVRSDVFFNDPSAEKRTKTGHSHAE